MYLKIEGLLRIAKNMSVILMIENRNIKAKLAFKFIYIFKLFPLKIIFN